MRTLEDQLYAIRMAGTPRPELDPRILLVAKDDATWAQPPGGKWGRHVYAAAIRNLGHAGASVVGLDLVFDTPKTEEDESLLEALASPLPVVAASEEQSRRSLGVPGASGGTGSPAARATTVSGPHPTLAPWLQEGFINLGRGRQVKAPAMYVELYREASDPLEPPRAGFAFQVFLDHLCAQALGTRSLPPPPGADSSETSWRSWLEGLPERPGPGSRFPDPNMERLLRRTELATLLRHRGLARAPDLVDRLERLGVGPLLPVRLPGPPPPGRVLFVDFSPPRPRSQYLPLYQVADQDAFEALQGRGQLVLDRDQTLVPSFGDSPLLPERTPLTGRLLGNPGIQGEGGDAWVVCHPSGLLGHGKLEPGGHFRVPGLVPGRADLLLVWRVGHFLHLRLVRSGLELPAAPLELRLPERACDLLLRGPPGDQVQVVSADLEGELPFHLSVTGRGVLPPDGQLLWQGFPAGEYALGRLVVGAPPGPPGFRTLTPGPVPSWEPPLLGPPPSPVTLEVPGTLRPGLVDLLRGGSREAEEGSTRLGPVEPGDYLLYSSGPGGQRRVHQAGRARIAGRLALLGTTMESDQDSYPTPVQFGQERDLPGVEVHAHALSNLLTGRHLVPLGSLVGLLAGALLLGASALAFHHLRPFLALTATVLLIGAHLALSAALLAGPGWILPVAPTLVAAAVFDALELTLFLRGAQKETEHILRVFGKCVDPVLRDRMLAAPHLVLAGERRTVTVLFSDIRGFTTLSEKLSPEELVGVLNDYFGRVTPVFLAHGGVFDKYIGDAFMGFFGAPLEQPDHAARGVRAALAMLDEHAAWKAERQAEGLPVFEVGFGLNTGEAIAGAVGSVESRINYSVLGDAVNVAARLESLCKEHKAVLLVSGDTLDRCGEEFEAEDLGEVQVKGRAEPVRVMRVR